MYFKNFTLLTLSAFALIVTLSVGCSKSNNSNNSSAGISATVGGTNFSSGSNATYAWYSTDSAVFIMGGYAVTNKDTSGLSLSIFPPFKLDSVISSQWAVNIDYYVNSSTDYFAGNGFGHIALIVTSQDTVSHKIGGTFTGTLYNLSNLNDSVQVTNGKFNTSYIVQP